MTHELFYTSAPRGLQAGSRGFCTVAMTRGLPPALAEKLEAVSGYRPLFPPHDARAALNPVSHAHLVLTAGGKAYHVLSRIGPADLDYSERSNKFAHHVVLDPAELPAAGPAWLLSQPGFMQTTWDGEVRVLPAGRTPPGGDARPAVCRAWQAATGDAGWAGVLAEAFLRTPGRPVYLVFEPGTALLPLVAEALALLPAERRWEVTFSTYFTHLPQGVACAWRCVPRESPEADAAARLPGALVLTVGPGLGRATGGGLVEQARTGVRPANHDDGADRTAAGPRAFGEPWSGRLAPSLYEPRAAAAPAVLATAVAPEPAARVPPPPPTRTHTPARRSWLAGLLVGLAVGIGAGAAAGAGAWFVFGPARDGHPTERGDEQPLPAVVVPEPKSKEPPRETTRREPAKARDRDTAAEKPPAATEKDKTIEALKKDLRESRGQVKALQRQLADRKQPAAATAPGKQMAPPPAAAADAKRVVKTYARLPLIHNGAYREEEPLKLQAAKAGVLSLPDGCTLDLYGLQTEVDATHHLAVEKKRGSLRVTLAGQPLARFQQSRDHLLFRWEKPGDLPEELARQARRRVRNAVLEVHPPGGETRHVGLMRDTRPPLVFKFLTAAQAAERLPRNPEELPLSPPLITALTYACQKPLPGPAALFRTQDDIAVRVGQTPDGELEIVAEWKGTPPGKQAREPVRLVLRSLAVSVPVGDLLVEVLRAGD